MPKPDVILAALLALPLLAAQAEAAPERYVGAAIGQQRWTCTSNSHEKCPLEASTGKRPQGEINAGLRWRAAGRLALGVEGAVGARVMESHGRNYPAGADVEGRFKSELGSIATQFNRDGYNVTATTRGTADLRVAGPVHAGPYVGLGGGMFVLDGDVAFAPVVEVGAGVRLALGERWSVTARYGLLHALQTTGLAGRPLSYTSHGPTVGLQFAF